MLFVCKNCIHFNKGEYRGKGQKQELKTTKKETTMSNKKQQKATVNPQTGLTPIQEQAAVLMASGETLTAVADKLSINRCTLYKWFENVAFQCYYNRQCQDVKTEVKNGVLGLCADAVTTLRNLLNNGNETTQLKACMWIMERAGQIDIGETNVKRALKKEATHPIVDANFTKVDIREYKSLLADYGVTDNE